MQSFPDEAVRREALLGAASLLGYREGYVRKWARLLLREQLAEVLQVLIKHSPAEPGGVNIPTWVHDAAKK